MRCETGIRPWLPFPLLRLVSWKSRVLFSSSSPQINHYVIIIFVLWLIWGRRRELSWRACDRLSLHLWLAKDNRLIIPRAPMKGFWWHLHVGSSLIFLSYSWRCHLEFLSLFLSSGALGSIMLSSLTAAHFLINTSFFLAARAQKKKNIMLATDISVLYSLSQGPINY